MAILKVEVGQPVTMTVGAVRQVSGKFGPQLAFDNTNGDTLFVKEDTAQRQLERIGYTQETAVGKPLHFEKVDKNGKTYLNINPAKNGNGASGAKAANGAQASHGKVMGGAPPVGNGASVRPLAPLYNDCVVAAKGIVQQHLGKAATSQDVIAAAATLYIAATKSNAPLYGTPAAGEEEEFPAALQDEDDSLPF